MLTRLSVDSLQWAIGLFCGFIGAFVLVAPHQFLFLPFAGTASHLVWWGLAALLSGAALLAVPVVRPGALATAAAHAGAGIVLLFLAGAFYGAGAWTGTIVYCVLGLGTGLAGLLPGAHRPAPAAAGDLLGLLMGGASMLAGLVALTIPRLYLVPFFDPSRHLLVWLGAGLLTSGPVLAGVQVRPVRRRLLRLAHLYAGLALFAYGLLVALPARAWTGVAVYCGGGLTVAALPWLRRWLERAEASTLQTRLALALALASTGALILAVAVVTTQEEQLAAEQAVSLQQIEADAIAQNIADFLEFNGARAAAVAATAGRAPMTPEAQGPYLESTGRIHPDVAAFATLGPAGEPLAATGGLNLPPGLARALALEIGGQAQPVLVLHVIEMRGRTRLLLSTPIPRPQGRRAGVLVSMLDPDSLSRRLSRPGSAITLADGHGRTIAVLDSGVDPRPPPPAGRQPAPLPRGWDADVAVGRLPRAGNLLAAFAAVPRIGWAVAVERPRAAALAGVRRGRDMAFLLLLLCAGLAVCAGVVTARRIARPLGTLADAVDQLTAGNRWAPLPPSNISEVARLSAAFGEMRDRLAERTAESERLAAELLARAEALADADRRKDEFLAMLAHELRNPLGAISTASYVLDQVGSSGLPPALVRASEVIRRQVRHLVRLVDDLLDVARITRGKVELKREPLDLVEVVRQAVDSNRPLVDSRGHDLDLIYSPAPLPVAADLTRLDQVFSNLIRNAVKFTPPGGRIAIAVERSSNGDGQAQAQVTIADSGIGISADLLPRVFDLFTQGEQPLDRSGAGLGIGLTLVRRIVELHGGRVEAWSDGRGRGAEFVVRLPLREV